MTLRIAPVLAGVLAIAGSALASAADAKTFYWISHGSPADPVWTYFLAGAEQWAEDTGNTVNTSFHNGDVASHQEAVRAAIAAGAWLTIRGWRRTNGHALSCDEVDLILDDMPFE